MAQWTASAPQDPHSGATRRMSIFEGIQEALDEAQYAHAVLDSKLAPLTSFNFPPPEVLEQYAASLTKSFSSFLTLEKMCSEPLGFYLLIRFLTDDPQTRLLGEFLRDMASFQASTMANHSLGNEFLKYMIRKYFQHNHSKQTSYFPFNPFLVYIPPPPSSPRGSADNFDEPTTEREILVNVTSEWNLNQMAATTNPAAAGAATAAEYKVSDTSSLFQVFVENIHVEEITHELVVKIGRIFFEKLERMCYNAFKVSQPFATYLKYRYIVDHTDAQPEDFLLLRIVGRGGFGKVYAARHVFTGKLCAVKIMTKKRMKYYSSNNVCLDERALLARVNSPFVLNLLFAFVTSDEISLVCDLLTGGSLDYHLRKKPFTLEQAKYFTARCILALQALHSQNIVYRDLKPQNVMLDSTGRSKLVDLGLASVLPPEGLTGRCGTRGYWAPEMLLKDENGHRIPYDFAVDWFSLGCCVYEFITGVCLFYSDQVMHYYETSDHVVENPQHARSADVESINQTRRARRHKAVDNAIVGMKVSVVAVHNEEAGNLIERLLAKNPKERLGCRGPEEVMKHPWFDDIDWSALDTVTPPFTPGHEANVCLISEIGDFPDEDEVCKVELTDEDHRPFEQWAYVNKPFFQRDLVEYLETQRSRGGFQFDPPSSVCCTLS